MRWGTSATPRVLDMCAGNGGKTLAMASELSDKLDVGTIDGYVIDAFDVDARRLRHLESNAERAGVSGNVRVVSFEKMRDAARVGNGERPRNGGRDRTPEKKMIRPAKETGFRDRRGHHRTPEGRTHRGRDGFGRVRVGPEVRPGALRRAVLVHGRDAKDAVHALAHRRRRRGVEGGRVIRHVG